ncbi:MAG: hypothetical protein KGH72_01935 [Candidatus Micrarchaeota archaeon]|nr:hypothetical protein [Candidatus Micrarchaeota archaeon]
MQDLLVSQISVQAVTMATLLLTIPLAIIMTNRYYRKRSKSLLFWSIGLWLFVLGVWMEVMFAFNIYSEAMIATYLFIVALLVNSLALGSIQFVRSISIRRLYYLFSAASGAALLYSLAVIPTGYILVNYVVAQLPPLQIIALSSAITFPAAVAIVLIALRSYRERPNRKLLSIISGVVIVSVAGSLYIVQFPAFLYVSEFIGILLLWYGFI